MGEQVRTQTSLNGWLVIDKPPGITSYDVIRRLKRHLPKALKIGHAGTLDPMATGVLPVALGQATRLIEYVHTHPKAYEARWVGGARTDTDDATGRVIESLSHDELRRVLSHYSVSDVRRAFYGMVGVYRQTPPMVSARKVAGKRLYELSRAGTVIPRDERPVVIYTVHIRHLSLHTDPPIVDFYVRTSKGTYIRTLVQDIGIKLGLPAHLGYLRRTESGGFTLKHARSLDHVLERLKEDEGAFRTLLYPLHAPLQGVRLTVPPSFFSSIQNGRSLLFKMEEASESIATQDLNIVDRHKERVEAMRFAEMVDGVMQLQSLVQLFHENGQLLALYRFVGKQGKALVLRAEKVFPAE